MVVGIVGAIVGGFLFEGPARWIILNIESADVKGDFAKLKAAGVNLVREPYSRIGMVDWPPNTWLASLRTQTTNISSSSVGCS